MRPILTLAIAVYWLAHFVLGALEAGQALAPIWAIVVATGNGIAATCFLWLAVEAVLDGEGTQDVAALATAAGTVLMATVAMGPALGGPAPETANGAVAIAALAACYAAIRLECGARDPRRADEDYSPRIARRMAAGAAHGSMLSRIAQRKPETAET